MNTIKTEAPKTILEFTIKQHVFGAAPEENHFILSDGRRLKDLKELADALDSMADDIFRSHVNESKNDFSNWTKDIFHEKELSEQLQQTNSKLDTQLAVLKHLVNKV